MFISSPAAISNLLITCIMAGMVGALQYSHPYIMHIPEKHMLELNNRDVRYCLPCTLPMKRHQGMLDLAGEPCQ
ncbi:MAG: hypothetical protein PHN86_09420 [Proteiniphilum sp.]|nr:hypothetical protein [Proteiniphilum sp.]